MASLRKRVVVESCAGEQGQHELRERSEARARGTGHTCRTLSSSLCRLAVVGDRRTLSQLRRAGCAAGLLVPCGAAVESAALACAGRRCSSS